MKRNGQIVAFDEHTKVVIDLKLDTSMLTRSEVEHMRDSIVDEIMRALNRNVRYFSPNLCKMAVDKA